MAADRLETDAHTTSVEKMFSFGVVDPPQENLLRGPIQSSSLERSHFFARYDCACLLIVSRLARWMPKLVNTHTQTNTHTRVRIRSVRFVKGISLHSA